MTREEAINNLESLYNEVYNEDSDGYAYAEAIDMAIEALQNEEKPRKVVAEVKVDIDEIVERIKEKYVFTDEVIRCKNCKNYSVEGETTQFGWCNVLEMPTDEQRFCADGERR